MSNLDIVNIFQESLQNTSIPQERFQVIFFPALAINPNIYFNVNDKHESSL